MARSRNSRSHDGFVRKLPNGSWQGCITVNGKDHRKVLRDKKGNTIKEERAAKRAWAVLRQKILEENPPVVRQASVDGCTTFQKGWENFIAAETARRNVSDRLRNEYSRNWRYLSEFAAREGVASMEGLSPELAKKFQIERAAKLSGSSVNKFQDQLRKIWKESFKSTPFDDFRAKGARSYRHSNLTDMEVSSLIAEARDWGTEQENGATLDWEGLFLLASQTGLRLSDCIHFDLIRDFKKIDENHGMIVLKPRKILNRKKNNREDEEGAATVKVPVGGALLWRILVLREEAVGLKIGDKVYDIVFEGSNGPVADPAPMFPDIIKIAEKDDGGNAVNKCISAIFKEAGISTEPFEENGQIWKKSFHSLRVYCVSKYGNAGCTLAQASAFWGWQVASMYSRYFRIEDDVAFSLCDKAFGK